MFIIFKLSFKRISFPITTPLPPLGKSTIKTLLVESRRVGWLVVGFLVFNLVKMSFFVKSFSSNISKQKPLLSSKLTKCRGLQGTQCAWENFPKIFLEWTRLEEGTLWTIWLQAPCQGLLPIGQGFFLVLLNK